jgi:dihydroorotate dehydrogenase (NAD+) catalytic subunit
VRDGSASRRGRVFSQAVKRLPATQIEAGEPSALRSPESRTVRYGLVRGSDPGACPRAPGVPSRGDVPGRHGLTGVGARVAPVLLNASGCLDALTAPRTVRALDAFVTKTVTPLPREGNPPVRIAETESGMLNSIGLANPGMDRFLAETLPRLARLDLPIWVSVGGFAAEDYAASCGRLDGRAEVAAIELNLSCPNVDEAPEGAAEIVARCRARTSKPLYAKLSAAVPNVAAVALAVRDAGADGLSLVNTIRGLALDPRTLRPRLGGAVGGYSGPALKPVALAAVFACYRATGLPIVGMGGVRTGRDALELIAAGATRVALGTILFADPNAPARVRAELAEEAAALGFGSPAEAHAAAHQGAAEVVPRLDQRSRVVL